MINLNCGLAMPQVLGHAAIVTGETVKRYVSDPDVMYRCQVRAQEYYGYDAVFPGADHSIVAESMGTELDYCRDGYPILARPALDDVRQWEDLSLPDPYRSGRLPVTIEACRRLRRTFGNQVPVVAKILGPMTIAGQLLGLEKLLFGLVDYPEAAERLLNLATEAAISYGKAQAEAGAHLVVIYDPMASSSIIPGEIFRRFELPKLKKICAEMKKDENLGIWFQCWLSAKTFSFVQEMGVDLVSIENHLDLGEALAGLPGMILVGNLSAAAFIESSPEEIKQMAKDCLKKAGKAQRFLLGGGCELPLESRPENIKALVEVAHQIPTGSF